MCGCRDCKALAQRLGELDACIAEAAAVAAPDGLADRVLIRHRAGNRWHYAATAAIVLTTMLAGATWDVWDTSGPSESMHVVGPNHLAVKAIAVAIEQHGAYSRDGKSDDSRIVQRRLRALGLSLKSTAISAHYAGKCYVLDVACDHIVLQTGDGRVNVMLVQNYPYRLRALVTDRSMAALVSPTGAGALVLVAASAAAARNAERLFSKF